jgi:hypothetical protein
LPSAAYAVDIPLLDPSFETFTVPAIGYAYSDEYRSGPMASAWVDDLDNPLSPPYTYFVDDGESAWLYNADYAEDDTFTKRASPRTGEQAMHGLGNYSAQETSAVFEANHTYTFSLWAQNDVDLDDDDGLFMYIFDASEDFNDPDSLASPPAFTAINARQADMSAEESAMNWTLLSVSHYVAPGAPEIGNPVGVGFFARRDTAVDDASLSVVPEPTSIAIAGLGITSVAVLGRRRRD